MKNSLANIISVTNAELYPAATNKPSMENIFYRIAELSKATSNDVSFVSSEKYIKLAAVSQAGLIIVPRNMELSQLKVPCLLVDNVWQAILNILPLFHPDSFDTQPLSHLHQTAVVANTATIGERVSIGPNVTIDEGAMINDDCQIAANCYIGKRVKISENVKLYQNVTLLNDSEIGKNCILHPGCVIGADGFRYEVINQQPQKIPHVGNVRIENDVEVGANSCIDRAFLGSTVIGQHTKIDNLVQIGHNCEIGAYNGMAAQVGISGSVKTGVKSMFWGQAGIAQNVTVGSNTVVGGQSGVISDLADNETVWGTPAVDHKRFFRNVAILRKLPSLLKKLNS